MQNLINLKICLVGRAPAAAAILKQEGIAFSQEEYLVSANISPFAAVFLGERIEKVEEKALKSYVLGGGTVIFDRSNKNLFSGVQKNSERISSYKEGNGNLIYINEELTSKFLNTSSVMKEFISEIGAAREHVARYSKSYLREMVSEALHMAYRLNGLPFVRFWYYPYDYRSAFNFRFDIDEDTKDDLELVSSCSLSCKDSTTWFVSCFAFKEKAFKIERLIKEGFDIESHGYFHHVYEEKDENRINITGANEYLNVLNCKARGFAAPKGKWNTSLQEVLEEENFLYSSEFSLDYDNLPFYPIVSGRLSKVLQIPVHPVCPELYADLPVRNEDEISGYFEAVLSEKYASCQPIFLYSHPNEKLRKNIKVLSQIYREVEKLKDVWRVRLTDFASWWEKRHEQEIVSLFFDRANGIIQYSVTEGAQRDMSFCICDSRERHFLYRIRAAKAAIKLNGLSEEACKELTGIKKWYLKERLYIPTLGKKVKWAVKEIIDWEEDTPLESIRRRSIKGNVKYYLRKLKAARLG